MISEPRAFKALEGVGDASLGEWVERTPKAVHVRRRISEAEQLVIGEVRDIRGTEECSSRLEILFAAAPHLKKFAPLIGEV